MKEIVFIFLTFMFLTTSMAFSHDIVNTDNLELSIGANFRTLYWSYTNIPRYAGFLCNEQGLYPVIARMNLSGNYKERIYFYFDGGYYNYWYYDSMFHRFDFFDEYIYIANVVLDLNILKIKGGLDLIPTGIEPSTRDTELHFLRPSFTTFFLTPERETGISFIFTPTIFKRNDLLNLSFGVYNHLNTERFFNPDGWDRRFLLDLPYLVSFDFRPIKQFRLTGYYGQDTAWSWQNGEAHNYLANNSIILYGMGTEYKIKNLGFNVDYFYVHSINRSEGFLYGPYNMASLGGQMTLYYRLPAIKFLSFEPAFRIDISDIDKHGMYDRTFTYSYGINTYSLDDHLKIMLDYIHPVEELNKEKNEQPTINDEFLAGFQITI